MSTATSKPEAALRSAIILLLPWRMAGAVSVIPT
jgi:hypothetical protein